MAQGEVDLKLLPPACSSTAVQAGDTPCLTTLPSATHVLQMTMLLLVHDLKVHTLNPPTSRPLPKSNNLQTPSWDTIATSAPSGDTASALILPPPLAIVFAGPPPAMEVMDFRFVVSRCSPAAAPCWSARMLGRGRKSVSGFSGCMR